VSSARTDLCGAISDDCPDRDTFPKRHGEVLERGEVPRRNTGAVHSVLRPTFADSAVHRQGKGTPVEPLLRIASAAEFAVCPGRVRPTKLAAGV